MQYNLSPILEKLLSTDRLSGYLTPYARNKCTDPIKLYLWNISLSEALYPLLQTVEVGLRNAINQAIINKFGNPLWLIGSDILEPREIKKVSEHKSILALRSVEPTIGKIIADLNFGFWVSLLDVRYEIKLWHKIIRQTFPYLPKTNCTRMHISKRFAKIRIIRNRVFHFEPIWHWQDLLQQHDQILEAIKWLDPELLKLVPADRFKEIYAYGAKMAHLKHSYQLPEEVS